MSESEDFFNGNVFNMERMPKEGNDEEANFSIFLYKSVPVSIGPLHYAKTFTVLALDPRNRKMTSRIGDIFL
jgi:hypothetical protein